MPIETLIHLTNAAEALGFRSTRAVRKLCKRFDIPVVRLNGRQDAIRASHYHLLLDRASGRSEAA
jgi:hypothetical protein